MARCRIVTAGVVGLVGLTKQGQAFVGSPVLAARKLSASTSGQVCYENHMCAGSCGAVNEPHTFTEQACRHVPLLFWVVVAAVIHLANALVVNVSLFSVSACCLRRASEGFESSEYTLSQPQSRSRQANKPPSVRYWGYAAYLCLLITFNTTRTC